MAKRIHPGVKKLTELLLPPSTPVQPIANWKDVERRLGIGLPEDYKSFIDLYGPGNIYPRDAAFPSLVMWNFGGPLDPLKLARVATRRYEEDVEQDEDLPFGGYPMKGGLLGWGTTGEGDFFNWRTRGKPNAWDVVFYHFSATEMILLEGSTFSQTLLDLLGSHSVLLGGPFRLDSFAPPCRYANDSW